jgi:hypothetical protein
MGYRSPNLVGEIDAVDLDEPTAFPERAGRHVRLVSRRRIERLHLDHAHAVEGEVCHASFDEGSPDAVASVRRDLRRCDDRNPTRRSGTILNPRVRATGHVPTEQPRGQRPMVRSLVESGDETWQRMLDELFRPFLGAEPKAEIHDVHLDFSPTTERQLRHRMYQTLHGQHRSFPTVVPKRRETLVEVLRPRQGIGNQLGSWSAGTGFDLGGTPRGTACVLFDQLATRSSIDTAHHRLGVSREMAEHVPDSPMRQERRTTGYRIGELADRESESLVRGPTPLDLHGRPVHGARAYDATPRWALSTFRWIAQTRDGQPSQTGSTPTYEVGRSPTWSTTPAKPPS